MRDLLLFRLLRAPELDPAALGPLLGELARLPLAERFPFLGLLPRALAHGDPALRAAAVAALDGADGLPAFTHLIEALADPDAGVRGAAVGALRGSSLGHPARFAHALFHPSAEVRRAALDGAWPPGTAAYTFALFADPACGPELLRRFDAGEEPAEHPLVLPAALPAVFDFIARGLLPQSVARRLVAEISWNDTTQWLRATAQRSEAEVAALLDAAARPEGLPPRGDTDAFDEIFALFWDEQGAEPRRDAFFRQLGAQMLAWPADLSRRAVASLLVIAGRRGVWPAAAAGIAAVFHPRFLGFAWVPRSLRHDALKAVYAAGSNVTRLPDDEVKALLAVDLCRRPSGSLDLWVVGGLLHFVEGHPYSRLLRWLPVDEVIAAFLEDVEHAVPFLSLRDDSKRGRGYILERLARSGSFGPGFLLALMTIASPVTGLDFLEPLEADDAAAVVFELLRLLRRMRVNLSAKKTTAIACLIWKFNGRDELVDRILRAWLDTDAPAELALGVSVLGALGVAIPGPRFVGIAAALPAPLLVKLLAALPACGMLPYGKEAALARALLGHADEAVRAWAVERGPPSADVLPVERRAPPGAPVPRLADAVLDAITASSDADLPAAVAPCLAAPTSGLCEALARRAAPPAPSVKVATAILGSHDPMERADAELGRFGAETPAFLAALDAEMVRVWEREANLPALGHAFVHRWERHAFAVVDELATEGLAVGLGRAAALSCEALRASVWDAVASAFAMWRWRDRARLAEVCSDALGEALLGKLDTDVGEGAARALAAIAEARVAPALVARLSPRVEGMLPDLTPEVRRILSSLADARGLTGGGVVRRATEAKTDASWLQQVRRSTDFDALETWCLGDNPHIVEEAALRLVELGEPGVARVLAAVRARAPRGPASRPRIESVALWPEGPSLDAARALAGDGASPPELRFRVALALVARGERPFLEHAFSAARVETDEPWLAVADLARLLQLGETERSLAIALAAAPHPHAYRRAVEHLLAVPVAAIDADVVEAVAAFLDAGTQRLADLRRKAARWLKRRGDVRAFPLLLAALLDPHDKHLVPGLLDDADAALIAAAVESVLLIGPRAAPDRLASSMLGSSTLDEAPRLAAYDRLVVAANTQITRAWAVGMARGRSATRSAKLRALAEAFAWGIRTGRALTGRLFKVEITTGKGLGYTRLNESRVYVSPIPVLTAAPHGRAIVEGLVLHELGHHLYHRGEEAARAWKTAEKEGIFGLLNLVADEHLERNLRGVDASYGDRLKLLGAYAFQHAHKDVPFFELLESLGGRAFDVLTANRLEVSREEGCVRVTSGALLLHLERAGLAFSRFFRALRMGLGDRHGDPRVSEALALCKGIRRLDMPALLALARRLRALFGWETRLVESFGPHESLEGSEAETTVHGEGITREELEREIERVLDPQKGERAGGGGSPGRVWINVSPDEQFEPLRNVVRVARDPAEHRRYAVETAFAARQMRRWLEALGVTLTPQRLRVRGRRFDPSRALAVVLRGDPRMLIAREPRVHTDLFLGVLVDCSGSMAVRDNIEKARLFGAMLAEAAKGLRGVDLHLYGFNDQTIFDAGDAAHCAVHALAAGGGNNDAGALWYAAGAARASRRRAKLLVMISDGLPTECSAAALRALVSRLGSRHGICCAQVAVQPLTEVCFPHYVELAESDPAPAVRRFGAIVAGLVKKAIAIA